jgi:hypothetical protein
MLITIDMNMISKLKFIEIYAFRSIIKHTWLIYMLQLHLINIPKYHIFEVIVFDWKVNSLKNLF